MVWFNRRRGSRQSNLHSIAGKPHDPLTLDQIRAVAPSVFATEPYEKMSEHYRFIPTVEVVEHMMDRGLVPVYAAQNRVRIPGKREFTRHVLRFQMPAEIVPAAMRRVGDIIPELTLRNAHDGSSAYVLYAGLFRLVCLNGMTVSDGTVECMHVRHTGSKRLKDNVTDASFEIIEHLPRVARRVNDWRNRMLTHDQQIAYADAATEIMPSSLAVSPEQLLMARRNEDAPAGAAPFSYHTPGPRDIWRTMNVVQENVMKGGIGGQTETGKVRRTKAVSSLDSDIRFNRALWRLTEELATLTR